MFTTFFSDKILKLHSALKSSSTVSSPHIPPKTLLSHSALSLWSLKMKGLNTSHSSNSFSDLDLITTSLLKQCLSALLPNLTNIINLSSLVPFLINSVLPLLKKYNFDREDLSNYRPISHLSSLSKPTERVVNNRLTTHLSTNNRLISYLPTPSIMLLSLLF